jgi:rhodanese-related sulfurtransferase
MAIQAREEVPVERLLRRARSRLDRLAASDVPAALDAGAVLVDIRSERQRRRDGIPPDAVVICRNVLEWRCDPRSPWCDERLVGRRLILLCQEGCQSSLAAATLHELGLTETTDVIGGFSEWRAAGLPVVPEPLS